MPHNSPDLYFRERLFLSRLLEKAFLQPRDVAHARRLLRDGAGATATRMLAGVPDHRRADALVTLLPLLKRQIQEDLT